MSFEARIKELGLVLPEPPRPAGRFVPAVQEGTLVFVSGQIPAVSGWLGIKGKLGSWGLLIEQGLEAARTARLNVLAVIQRTIGVAELPLGAPVELELIVEIQY